MESQEFNQIIDKHVEEIDRLADLAKGFKRDSEIALESANGQSGKWFPRLRKQWTHRANFKRVLFEEVMQRIKAQNLAFNACT